MSETNFEGKLHRGNLLPSYASQMSPDGNEPIRLVDLPACVADDEHHAGVLAQTKVGILIVTLNTLWLQKGYSQFTRQFGGVRRPRTAQERYIP